MLIMMGLLSHYNSIAILAGTGWVHLEVPLFTLMFLVLFSSLLSTIMQQILLKIQLGMSEHTLSKCGCSIQK